MRARIQIRNHVQDVGFRSIVTAILIENGIKKGLVINDKKDANTVNVILDEEEEMLNNIREALNAELQNKEEFPQLPEPFTVSDWEKTDSNPAKLPDLSPYVSDALQLRQMSKFVGVGIGMSSTLDRMNSNLGTMNSNLGTMNSNLDRMNTQLAKLDNLDRIENKLAKLDKLDSIETAVKSLPENLARELAKLKKNGLL